MLNRGFIKFQFKAISENEKSISKSHQSMPSPVEIIRTESNEAICWLTEHVNADNNSSIIMAMMMTNRQQQQ